MNFVFFDFKFKYKKNYISKMSSEYIDPDILFEFGRHILYVSFILMYLL